MKEIIHSPKNKSYKNSIRINIYFCCRSEGRCPRAPAGAQPPPAPAQHSHQGLSHI